jgi:hypothetical protein
MTASAGLKIRITGHLSKTRHEERAASSG